MYISATNSTNTLLRERIAQGNPPAYIYTGFQSAGRGQAGNGWESEKDKNLLCSILLPPRENLFELNTIVSVAVRRTVQRAIGGSNLLTIKWPNDIYYGDKKIAGILIENALIGNEVKYSIAGIGLNLNQTHFLSNAPNPLSLKQITGREYDPHALMQQLLEELDKAQQEDVWHDYCSHLYRRDGFWPFVERKVSTAPTMNARTGTQGVFMAHIREVLPTGEIVLEDQQGKERTYHFKQIRYVIGD